MNILSVCEMSIDEMGVGEMVQSRRPGGTGFGANRPGAREMREDETGTNPSFTSKCLRNERTKLH